MDGEEVLQRRVLGEREQHRTRAAQNDTFLGTAELSLGPTTSMSAGTGLNEDAFCGLDSIYSFKDPKVVFHGDTTAGGVRNKVLSAAPLATQPCRAQETNRSSSGAVWHVAPPEPRGASSLQPGLGSFPRPHQLPHGLKMSTEDRAAGFRTQKPLRRAGPRGLPRAGGWKRQP